MVHDLGVGINFHDVRLAQPGDFLKIFWSESIGATERGHLVIYLGLERKNGTVYLKYWSANKPGGYGVKSSPFSRMHNLIFTRITAPQNFVNVTKLPPLDNWLADMQHRSYTFAEVRQKCSIANGFSSSTECLQVPVDREWPTTAREPSEYRPDTRKSGRNHAEHTTGG